MLLNPNNINLVGAPHAADGSLDNSLPIFGSGAKPGMIVEMFNNSGVLGYRAHSAAANVCPSSVLLSLPEMNKGIEDAYGNGDRAMVWYMRRGQEAYMLVASGVTVTQGDPLQSNGDGTLKAATAPTAAAGVACWVAKETLGTTTGVTRCRVKYVGV